MVRKEIRSFGFAFRGLKFLFLEQPHFRFHLLATVLVVAVGFWVGITHTEWAIVLICCASVLGMEALNSALEVALDRLHPERHPLVGKAKDMAAAGVLLMAAASAVIGVMVFWPYLIE